MGNLKKHYFDISFMISCAQFCSSSQLQRSLVFHSTGYTHLPLSRVRAKLGIVFFLDREEIFSYFYVYLDRPGEGTLEKDCCW